MCGWLAGWLVGWWVGGLVGWWVGLLVWFGLVWVVLGWVRWFVGWLVGWMVGLGWVGLGWVGLGVGVGVGVGVWVGLGWKENDQQSVARNSASTVPKGPGEMNDRVPLAIVGEMLHHSWQRVAPLERELQRPAT